MSENDKPKKPEGAEPAATNSPDNGETRSPKDGLKPEGGAAQAETSPSPATPDRLEAARTGVAAHEQHKQGIREHGPLGGGWEVMSVDQKLGGTGRPDAVYVNHEQQRIVVEDLYTGSKKDVQTPTGPESRAHYDKGWNYSQEPKIKELTDKGYSYEYVVAPWNPKQPRSELH